MVITTAICGKTGSKCLHGLNWNVTSTFMGKTYTTLTQNYSEATVSFVLSFDPGGCSQRKIVEEYRLPIDIGANVLKNCEAQIYEVNEFKITMRGRTVYIVSADVSALRARNFIDLYLRGGLDYLPNYTGEKFPRNLE